MRIKLFSVFAVGLMAVSTIFAQQKMTRAEYIQKYSPTAIKNMKDFRIPASITMAQACLESADGNSSLAKESNNHFGIKCHSDWSGEKRYKDDDSKNECFRVYKKPEESYKDHAEFLTTKSRYAFLFELEITDYKAWAEGLKKAGYATNPNYPQLLTKIIEDNKLYELDKEGANEKKNNQPQIKESIVLNETAADGYKIMQTKNYTKYVIAKGGETPKQIAKPLFMREWQIIKYNEVDKNFVFEAGSKILIQPKRNRGDVDEHIVVAGETLWHISEIHAVKISSLERFNNIKKTDELTPGMVINLRVKKQ